MGRHEERLVNPAASYSGTEQRPSNPLKIARMIELSLENPHRAPLQIVVLAQSHRKLLVKNAAGRDRLHRRGRAPTS